jgi:hypothetical protein
MPQKLFVNNSGYQVNGNLTVRAGDEPSNQLNSVQFVLDLAMGSQQFVQYGDENNPYVDELQMEGLINGGYLTIDQTVVTRGSDLDDFLNTNDTIIIALQGPCFLITSTNTWS